MSSRTLTPAFALLLAAAIAMNFQLSRQIRTLGAAVNRERQRAHTPQVGQFLPALSLRQPSGDSIKFVPGTRTARRVLLFHASTCGFCDKEAETWTDLITQASANGYDTSSFIAVSYDSTDAGAIRYATQHRLNIPFVRVGDDKTRSLLRVAAVPATVVIDGDGKITFARTGALSKSMGIDSTLKALGSSNVTARAGSTSTPEKRP